MRKLLLEGIEGNAFHNPVIKTISVSLPFIRLSIIVQMVC